MEEVFESAVRSTGDYAGVFEFDGDVGFFYLYKNQANHGNKVQDSIRIFSDDADLAESDIVVQWNMDERSVGLLIRGVLWAVFDCDCQEKFGGDYKPNAESSVPKARRLDWHRRPQ